MRRKAFAVAAALVFMVSGTGIAGDGSWLTIDDIFGSRQFASTAASNVQWLPDGSGVIYRDTRDGDTGLYRFDVSTRKETRVVSWDQTISALKKNRAEWVKPSMDDVNTHTRNGVSPSISPDGRFYLGIVSGDLFLLDLTQGTARFITQGPDVERFPTFSPDGTMVAFVRSGDLFVVDVVSGAEARLTDRGGESTLLNGVTDWVYEEELGVKRSFWWSPDSTRILFVQYDTSPIEAFPITDDLEFIATVERQRYPKAGTPNSIVRLGVVPVTRGSFHWVATGVGEGYIARAGWWPDGSRTWAQVLNRDQTRLELRIAVPGQGTSSVVVMDQADDWVNVRDDLVFVSDDRFIWSSERDGWRHLYYYAADGTLIRRLTGGPWQVEKVYGLDSTKKQIVFQANREDHRERHLYTVPLDGGSPKLLNSSAGTHSANLAPDGRHFVDSFSSLTTPTRLDLFAVDGRKVATIDDGSIPALDGLDIHPPEFASIKEGAGETLHTMMFKPPDFDPAKKYPVLVYVYGGPGAQMVVNRWGSTRFLFLEYLTRKGLIVFTLDNRGSWGRGHGFEAPIHRRLGEVELEDQLIGVKYLKRQPWVDSDRIGVYGGSYGGYMTLVAMNRAPEHFKVGIAYAPVTDWRLYDSIYTERYMDTPEDNLDGYRDSAPLNYAAGLDGRLLICHGLMDNNVHFQQSVKMAEEYIKAEKLIEMMIYPRTRHGIRVSGSRVQFHKLKADFLQRHLIKEGPAPAQFTPSNSVN